jgi:thiol-disulfide isomerase/thioredoxin
VLASVLASAGLTTDRLRLASAVVLGLVGLTLAANRVGAWAERRLSPVAGFGTRLTGRRPRDGLAGGLVLGAAIGLVWAPCVGPIMAGVIATAATRGPTLDTIAVALAYVAGVALPIGLIATWGQRASDRMRRAVRSGRLRRGLGVAMLATAVLVASGLDLTVENAVADALPAGWSGGLVAVEQQPAVQQELDVLRSNPANASSTPGNAPAVALEDLGPAPEVAGIQAWINSDPISIASLRGKVVLVEFWTFACINCIHVQPYVSAWYDWYAAEGLVVIGVHTPELSFERELDNVRDAVAKAGIRYPVAVDPGFATWNAYRNSYWPALYFIGRDGRIRHLHIGEGDYDGSERVIRELLAQPA